MNRSYWFLLLSSLAGPVFAMEQSLAANAAKIARSGTITEFKDLLIRYCPNTLGNFRLSDNSNLLHVVAYPFTYQESREYAIAHNANYCFEHDMAREHAYRADLLLKVCDTKSLFTKNSEGKTPAVLAAETGYLPVLARIMLSSPGNWQSVVSHISADNSDTLISSFLEMMSVKHLYPGIRTDLHSKLSQKELIALYKWAQKAQIERLALPKNKVLKKLSLDQIQCLCEYYLMYDIHQQYQKHRWHPKVERYFGTN